MQSGGHCLPLCAYPAPAVIAPDCAGMTRRIDIITLGRMGTARRYAGSAPRLDEGKRAVPIVFAVEGKPVTQGSMTAVYNRKTGRAAIRHVQSLPLAKWRRAIKEAAQREGAYASALPVSISIVFGMPRPKSHLHRDGTIKAEFQDALPMHRDIDKLIRAVLDALTGTCYDDDSQVVNLTAMRVYGDSTEITVDYVKWEDAARMARYTQESISTRQLPLPLLR